MTIWRRAWIAMLAGSACIYFYQGVTDGVHVLGLLFSAVFAAAAVISTIRARHHYPGQG